MQERSHHNRHIPEGHHPCRQQNTISRPYAQLGQPSKPPVALHVWFLGWIYNILTTLEAILHITMSAVCHPIVMMCVEASFRSQLKFVFISQAQGREGGWGRREGREKGRGGRREGGVRREEGERVL